MIEFKSRDLNYREYAKMKTKYILSIIVLVFIFFNCNSENDKLQGTWSLAGIDDSGKTGDIFKYILSLYGYDVEQEAELLRARGDYLGAAIADERASYLKNNQKEIMIQMIDILKPLGFDIIFEKEQIKMEIMGQRVVNKYKIKNNAIISEQNGIETESDFKIEGDKLFYSGFIWERKNN